MKVRSSHDFPETGASDAAIAAAVDIEQRQKGASSMNGSILGLVLMASISLPLVCMAGIRLHQTQSAPLAPTQATASQEVQAAVVQSGAAQQAAAQPAAVQPAAQYIYWNYNFQEAQQQATTSNKSMMIDFYADWCPSCKSLDAKVYTDPQIIAEAQNFVPIKINAEAQLDLARQYNISKYP
ncbi:DUF255 domain-containing protein, partial [bacterium]